MGSTLTVDNIVGATTAANVKMPAGAVMQVVSTQLNTRFTRSGSTEADITGLAVTITPKFNTSKIMIIVSLTIGSGTTSGHHFRIKRTISGGSAVTVGGGDASLGTSLSFCTDGANADTNRAHSLTYHAFDSPSTTTATTYHIAATEFGSQTLHMNSNTSKGGQAFDDAFASHITAMEISG